MKISIKTYVVITFAFFSFCNVYSQLQLNESGAVIVGGSNQVSSNDLTVNGSSYLSNDLTAIGDVVFGSYKHPSTKLTVGGRAYITSVATIMGGAYIFQNSGAANSTLRVGGANEGNWSIYADGPCYSPSWNTTSDKRLKKNITQIDGSIDKLMKISGKSYSYKNKEELKSVKRNIKQEYDTVFYKSKNGQDSIQITEKHPFPNLPIGQKFGILAQDIEPILPELVHYDSIEGLYSVDYMGFIPILIEGLKEQQAQLDKQEADIAELKKQVSNLAGTGKNKPKTKSAEDIDVNNSIIASLSPAKPNPFNTETSIEFYLPADVGKATLYVYDLQGKQIKSINIVQREHGSETIYASELTPGMYKYALIADGSIVGTETMILTD